MINYSGYIEAEVNDEDFAILQGGSVPESLGELKENQYIIAKDRFGKCGYFQFKDNKVKQILYTELGNDYTGKIKPLNDQQVCAFHMLKDKDIPVKLITGKFGTGKAQPVDTMVPTPMGAKRLGDIEVGDYLFARDGRKTKVLGVFPQGVLTNYRVELSDGRVAFCNDEHIWTCIDKDGNFFDTTIKEIINSCMLYEGEYYQIPWNEAVKYEAVIDERDFYKEGHLISCEIQKEYMTAPIDQRLRLLAGIVDSKGFIKGRHLYLKLRDYNLVKDIFSFLMGLGIYAYHDDGTVQDNIIAEIHLCLNENQIHELSPFLYMFDLEREIDPEEKPTLEITDIYSVGECEMVCVLVDNPEHLYLTENYIVTHNTMANIVAALEAVQKGDFERIIFIRNNVQVAGTDPLGALPGDEHDKLLPYLMPFADHCGGVEGIQRLIEEEKLEVIPLAFLRGRSIRNAILYSMESENLTKEHIQLILGRVDKGSQLWMDGDIKQRDKAIFEKSQGLETMIERLAGNPLFGYVNLVKSERSSIAALSDLLD